MKRVSVCGLSVAGLVLASVVLAASPPVLLAAWAEDASLLLALCSCVLMSAGVVGLVASRRALLSAVDRDFGERSGAIIPPAVATAARVCVWVVAAAGFLGLGLAWQYLTPLWAFGYTSFYVTLVFGLIRTARAVRDASFVDAQRVADQASAQSGADRQARAWEFAFALSSRITPGGVASLPAIDPGPTLLRSGEQAHLLIPLHVWRLVDGTWVGGHLAEVLVTPLRLVARTAEYGELSFWWDGVVAHSERAGGVELHYESGAPLLLNGDDGPVIQTYTRAVLARQCT